MHYSLFQCEPKEGDIKIDKLKKRSKKRQEIVEEEPKKEQKKEDLHARHKARAEKKIEEI